MLEVMHGRAVRKIGNRYFAVTVKPIASSDRVHAQQAARSDWFRGRERGKHARVIGQRFARQPNKRFGD